MKDIYSGGLNSCIRPENGATKCIFISSEITCTCTIINFIYLFERFKNKVKEQMHHQNDLGSK